MITGRVRRTARFLRGMLFGDSLSNGFGDAESARVGGWRLPFYKTINARRPLKLLGSDNYIGPVPMCGTSGLRIDELNAGQYAPVEIKQYPNLDFSTFYIGMNNCTQLNSGTWVGGSIAQAMLDYHSLLNTFRAYNPKAIAFVLTVNPNTLAGANTYITQLNSAINSEMPARSDGNKIVIIDLYTAIQNISGWDTTLMADNTHFNQAGYNKVATTISNTVSLYF